MMPQYTVASLPIVIVAITMLSTDAGRADQQIPPGGFRDKPVELTIDEAFELLRRFEAGQSRQPINLIEHEVYRATADAAAATAIRGRLLAALNDPDSTYMCRKLVCHNWLPLVAGDEAVPALVSMLGDDRDGLLAVDALQRIAGRASADALRGALTTATGDGQIMAIHAVGQRRDDAAVPALIRLTRLSDDAVSSAALAALGVIGSADAATALLQAGDTDERVLAEAKLQCAQRRLQAGDPQTAARLCETLYVAGGEARLRMAALTGLAGARGVEVVPRLRAALEGNDPTLAAHATELLVNLPGEGATAAILAVLQDVDGDKRAALLRGLGRRGDRATLGPIVCYLRAEDQQVRLAAIEAVGRLGDVSVFDLLIGIAASQKGETQRAARAALVDLRDDAMGPALVTCLAGSEPGVRAEAIRVAAARQMMSIKPRLLALATDAESRVRAAAYEGLRELAGPDDYKAAIRLAVDARSEDDRGQALELIRVVGRQIGDTSARTVPVLAAIERADVSVQVALLPLLSGLGDDAALRALVERLPSADAAVKDAAIRTLADWPDAAALPHLLAVARESVDATHRALATRGYLRLLPRAADVAAAATEILPQVRSAQEKAQLAAGLANAEPSQDVLRIAIDLLQDPAVRAETLVAVERIAAALVEQQPDLVLDVITQLRGGNSDNAARERLSAIEQRASAASTEMHGRIDPGMPNGNRLACYLNAGAAAAGASPAGPVIRQLRGKSWRYAPDAGPPTTVAFDSQQVEFEISGLRADHRYMLGITWWDVDNNGRLQSIAMAPADNAEWITVLPRTRPVAYHADQATYAVLHLPIAPEYSAAGKLRVRFKREGPSNAVVNELWLLEQSSDDVALKRVAIVTGDDYPGHRWRETAPELAAILHADPRLEVTIVESPAILGSPLLEYFDAVVVHFKNYHTRMPTDPAECAGLEDYVRAGGGLVVAHFGCGAFQEWSGYVRLAGRVWNPRLRGHDPYGPFTVHIVDEDHPITRGMADFKTADELYTCLDGDTQIHTLCNATSTVDQREYPMAFTLQVGRGRVFHCPLGHDVNALRVAGTRALYRRAAVWVSGLEPGAEPATVKSDDRHDGR